jgi:hypothetical protein
VKSSAQHQLRTLRGLNGDESPHRNLIQNGLHKIDEQAGICWSGGLVAVRVTLFVSQPTTVAQSFNEVNVSDDRSQHVWIHEFMDPDREVTVFRATSLPAVLPDTD